MPRVSTTASCSRQRGRIFPRLPDNGGSNLALARHGAQSRDEGFTLLELLVVLGIIALLATVAAPQVLQYLGKARTETARAQISAISTALELYALDNGGFPPQQLGLSGLVNQPSALRAGRDLISNASRELSIHGVALINTACPVETTSLRSSHSAGTMLREEQGKTRTLPIEAGGFYGWRKRSSTRCTWTWSETATVNSTKSGSASDLSHVVTHSGSALVPV